MMALNNAGALNNPSNFNKIGLRFLSAFILLLMAACSESGSEQSNAMHLERAKAYQEQGQYKAAMIEYKNAIKNSAGDAKPLIRYADMMNKLGRFPLALDILNQVAGEKTEAYYSELVQAYQGMKKYISAGDTIKNHLPSESIQTNKLQAEVYLGLNDLVKAQSLFQEILDTSPKDGQAILGKATALVRLNKVKESLALLGTIDSKNEFYVKARILTAGIQINQEHLDDAEGILSELVSELPNTDILEPEKAVVLERLSYVLTRQGRSNEAYIYSKILAEAFPGSNEVKEQYQSAVEKLKSGEQDASKAELTEILTKYPNYNPAKQLMGVISYLQGDNEAASKYLSDSVDPEVASDLTKHIYAATELKLNEPKKVLEILGPTIEHSQIPATLALYGLAAISDKQFTKGENALLKAIKIEGNNIRVRLALAGYYRNKPQPDSDKEWQQLEKSFEIASTDKQVLKYIVGFHLKQGNVDKARQFIMGAVSKNPQNYATNLMAGFFSIAQHNVKDALKYFTVAASVNKAGPDYLNALFAKGKTELTLKKMSDAKTTFSEIIRVFPEREQGYKGLFSVYIFNRDEATGEQELTHYAERNAQIAPYLVLIQSAVAKQDVQAAQKFYQKAKALKPDNVALNNLGNAIHYVEAVEAMKKKDFAKARSVVASILSSEPDNLRLLSFLVDLEIKAGKTKEAAKVLKQIEVINASHPVVALLKGDIAIADNNLQLAKQSFAQAWKNNPSEAAANKLFKALSLLHDKTAQNQHINSWLEKFPDSLSATLFQASNFQQTGQVSKAAKGYEKILKASPNNVMALNNLGWIYFEKKDDRALGLLKQANKLLPDSAAILDSYGWVLVKTGKLKEGLVLLEKANKLSPDNTEIADHLKEAKGL